MGEGGLAFTEYKFWGQERNNHRIMRIFGQVKVTKNKRENFRRWQRRRKFHFGKGAFRGKGRQRIRRKRRRTSNDVYFLENLREKLTGFCELSAPNPPPPHSFEKGRR